MLDLILVGSLRISHSPFCNEFTWNAFEAESSLANALGQQLQVVFLLAVSGDNMAYPLTREAMLLSSLDFTKLGL